MSKQKYKKLRKFLIGITMINLMKKMKNKMLQPIKKRVRIRKMQKKINQNLIKVINKMIMMIFFDICSNYNQYLTFHFYLKFFTRESRSYPLFKTILYKAPKLFFDSEAHLIAMSVLASLLLSIILFLVSNPHILLLFPLL